MSENKFENYYIGLDVGTSSVGWAVTDTNYNILRHQGKDMWGVHLFDEAQTAQDRRMHRTARRRLERRHQRLELLQELMKPEIDKVDPKFFQHLRDSKFYQEDREDKDQKYSIFNDSNYTDQAYHREFPTVYHLRRALMTDAERKFDIRLIYLAIAHILKSRGNFLHQNLRGDNLVGSAFDESFKRFVDSAEEILGIDFTHAIPSGVKDAFLKAHGIKRRSEELERAFGAPDDKQQQKQCKELMKMLAGGKVKLSNIFAARELDDEDEAPEIDFESLSAAIADAEQSDLKSFEFSSPNYDEEIAPKIEFILGDACELIENAKALYDWSVLANILGEHSGISEAMIDRFERHRDDLGEFVELVQVHLPGKYREIFSETDSDCNYQAWCGNSVKKNNKSVCSQEEFYKFLKGVLPKDGPFKHVLDKIDEGSFLPKLRTGENGVIPYQLHEVELKKILDNAARHYPFLKETDADGISVSDKIVKLLNFRIPYFVGPLSDKHQWEKDKIHGHAWIVRRPGMEKERILPWNFEKVVDLGACAENFIRRMTEKCTYLPTCDVLPKESLLFSEYLALNQLNNLRIEGKPIDQERKMRLWKMCRARPSVSAKDMAKELGLSKDALSGFDGELKISLKSYHDFKGILGDSIDGDNVRNFVEDCILDITIFGEEKKELKKRIERRMAEHGISLDEKQVGKICGLNYNKWSTFSREFLTRIEACFNNQTGECGSILTALENTTENLMQLLGNKYKYKQEIDNYNRQYGKNKKFTYEDLVAPLYCSPAVKRAIWRTLAIVKDIQRVTKQPPKRIFVEMAREDGDAKKGQRTTSRKKQLEDLYANIKNAPDVKKLLAELGNFSDADLRRGKDRLFLYFLQLGKCMYSGGTIELSDMLSDKNGNIYDVDHIYPQSKVVDNSLNNRVLVKKELNHRKGDRDLCNANVVEEKVRAHWRRLLQNGLLSREKYDRLTRNSPLTADELAGFIDRQLVETRQATKAICQVLRDEFEKEGCQIVYSHAGRVSEFRRDFEFGKCRDVNDFHHAKDAYLNIVVGNVYHTKFTANPAAIFKNEKVNVQYMTKSGTGLLQSEIRRGNEVAWNPETSLQIVRHWMESSRILYTRYAFENKGGFYDQNPLKAANCGDAQIPLKTTDKRFSDVKKYGGYDNQSIAYFFLVEYTKKKKVFRTFKPVPVRLAKRLRNNKDELLKYCETPEPQGLGLENPKIVVPKILINSKFEFDGFPFLLTGRSNNRILIKHCVQLVLTQEEDHYLKKVLKFANGEEKSKEITSERNLSFYKLFIQKHETSIYSKRPASQLDTLKKGWAKFEALNEYDQCKILKNILVLFSCGTGGMTDLSAIGGSKNAGFMMLNMDITKVSSARMLNESPTGLTTHIIDDLKTYNPSNP